MKPEPAITGIISALEQAGVTTTSWCADTISLSEVSGLNLFSLRALPHAQAHVLAGIELPQRVGQCSTEGPSVLCLGPKEWLVISESAESVPPSFQPDAVPQDEAFFCSDISSGQTVFRLSGSSAPWLLSKLSGLDFLSGIHAGEHCARTRIGQVTMILYFHSVQDESAVFDLIFDRSLARYVLDLISASAPHAEELAIDHGEAA